MTVKSLADVLQGDVATTTVLRNSQIGPYVYPAVPAEFSNWRDEQVAWRTTCALFDQSHHMTDLVLEGPDAVRLVSDLGVNSFDGFRLGKAKQFVACNDDGFVIGDAVLCFVADQRLELNGRPSAINWIQFHAETGGYDVLVTRDERTAVNPTGRRAEYRYQVQGPTAGAVMAAVTDFDLSRIRFFNLETITIAGHQVHALGHGMSGAPGWELFGPWEDGPAVKAALIEAGAEHGLRQVGSRTYASNTLESGWIPGPLPAVYTGQAMAAYREWLPATSYEATGSLGGSFESSDITDYYLTPYDLGYGGFVKFDHDFVGRRALEAMDDRTHRRKVTLAWNGGDVAEAMSTMFDEARPTKFIDLPLSNYSTWPYDAVRDDGRLIGFSTFTGYSFNERTMLSLAMLDTDVEIGSEVVLTWGEADGGSAKPVVERHRQTEIRAVVSPCPYSDVARTSYAKGWRTAGTATR